LLKFPLFEIIHPDV